MWIVMTASAPNRAGYGPYRNIALVELNQHYTANGLIPRMRSEHAKGVLRVVDCGTYRQGSTLRSKYVKALQAADEEAKRLNNSPLAGPELLFTLGGSA